MIPIVFLSIYSIQLDLLALKFHGLCFIVCIEYEGSRRAIDVMTINLQMLIIVNIVLTQFTKVKYDCQVLSFFELSISYLIVWIVLYH